MTTGARQVTACAGRGQGQGAATAATNVEGCSAGASHRSRRKQRHTEEHGLQHACMGTCIRTTSGKGILNPSHRAHSWWCCSRCSTRLRLCTLAGCKTLIRRPRASDGPHAAQWQERQTPPASMQAVAAVYRGKWHHHQERPCSCSHLLLLLLLCAGAGEHHGRGSAVKACARKAQRQGAEAAENASAVKSAAELRAAAQ